jgi:hypothetical protein
MGWMPKILKNRVFKLMLRRLECPVIIYGNGGGAAESLGCRRRLDFPPKNRRRRLSRSTYTSINE